MCDTFVALADTTPSKEVIFGKNSDRPKGEIQDVITISAQKYSPGTFVQCTYIKIPQVKETLAAVLSKPRWMWGAEMGANEPGVVIGNEAVWTNQPYRDTGLLGMDLVRLGLERGATALHALEVIVNLLDEYGQGGNCAEHFAFNYHNSFIIADQNEAWVLETAGVYWVAEKITTGTRSISNNLSIYDKGDRRHLTMIDEMIDQGKHRPQTKFEFATIFSSQPKQEVSPHSREGRVRRLCTLNEGSFDVETAKSILRDHTAGICWHGDYETRGSQISALSQGAHKHWFIEKPFPCQQDYKAYSFLANPKLRR